MTKLFCLLKRAGFASVDIFGVKKGAFGRSDRLTPDNFEMLAVATKA
jgi:hypothetical protein